LIDLKDSLLALSYAYNKDYDELRARYISTLFFLNHVENWIYDRAVEGSWLYYSYDSMKIEAIDLSNYKMPQF
jgi:hypothetical protein